jgi:hypothetical protein
MRMKFFLLFPCFCPFFHFPPSSYLFFNPCQLAEEQDGEVDRSVVRPPSLTLTLLTLPHLPRSHPMVLLQQTTPGLLARVLIQSNSNKASNPPRRSRGSVRARTPKRRKLSRPPLFQKKKKTRSYFPISLVPTSNLPPPVCRLARYLCDIHSPRTYGSLHKYSSHS